MTKLPRSAAAWPSDSFSATIKNELEELEPGSLPLDKATQRGGYVDDSSITCTVFNFKDENDHITIKTGIFFTEILICCGCGDDPVPENAYCELMISLDKKNAGATFEIIETN